MPETAARGALHPRTEELLEHLDETRAAFLTAVAAAPPARRTGRPVAGRWSLGEVLDHVHKVETGLTRLLVKRIAQARERGVPPETDESSIFGMMDSQLLVDRRRPIEAPSMVLPAEDASVDEGLAALGERRAQLRAAVIDTNGLALATITHPHPVFGPLDMYQWVLLLGWHDLRHAAQVREIGSCVAAG